MPAGSPAVSAILGRALMAMAAKPALTLLEAQLDEGPVALLP